MCGWQCRGRDNKTGDVNRTKRSKSDTRALQQRDMRISDQRAERLMTEWIEHAQWGQEHS